MRLGGWVCGLALLACAGEARAGEEPAAAVRRLERQTAAQPARLDLQFALSHAYERADRLEDARRVAEAILARTDSYDARLRLGWLALCAERWGEAERHYRAAAAHAPRALDPRLGLQRALLEQERWEEALEAGQAALALEPDSYWAHVRQGYVRWMRGEVAAAEREYDAALALRPGDGEALLGLAFVRAHQERRAEARDLCDQAGAALGPDDPRLDAAREAASEPLSGPRLALVGFGYGYSGSDLLRSSWGATAWVTSPDLDGFELSGGASYCRSALRGDPTPDAVETTQGAFNLVYREPEFDVGFGVGYVASNDDAADGAWTLRIGGGMTPAPFGGRLDAALAVYPDFEVIQVDPWLLARGATWELGLGPELSLVLTDVRLDRAPGAGRRRSGSSERSVEVTAFGAAQAAAAWFPLPWLAVRGAGWIGNRRFPVDLEGPWAWTTSEQLRFGYRLTLGVDLGRRAGASISFAHVGGEELLGHGARFDGLGVILGAVGRF